MAEEWKHYRQRYSNPDMSEEKRNYRTLKTVPGKIHSVSTAISQQAIPGLKPGYGEAQEGLVLPTSAQDSLRYR